MSLLPDLRREPKSQDLVELAAQEAQQTELTVFRSQLAVRAKGEIDQTESVVLGDAIRISLDEEVATLNYGLSLANGDPAIVALTARKVEMQSQINNQRIYRTFRG